VTGGTECLSSDIKLFQFFFEERTEFRMIGHKKGLHNYEVDSYEIILSAFKEFTTPENAQRIYREGVKTLFPKLKE
jgi:hypothetical protein